MEASKAGSFGDKISTRTGGSDIFNLGGIILFQYEIQYIPQLKNSTANFNNQTMMQL
jgi:hypothetical protein